MSRPDLNMLFTLDVLLAEGNVARAARRLHLSPSAMSRALARLREATGDPLLVRAGRGLVASPRALELRDSIGRLVHEAEAALRPASELNLGALERTFTIRSSEGFVENFGAPLLARISGEAPKVRLHFLHKLEKDSGPMRDGSVDLETGVVDKAISPEVRTQALFRDRYVGVVRMGHPLNEGKITPARFAAAEHVHISRRDNDKKPVDEAFEALGLERKIATIVGGFSAALALVRATDLVACVHERHTGNLYAVVNTRLDAMAQALTRPDSSRELEAMCTWLSMATCIAKGLERAVELLPAAIAGSARTGVTRLTGRIRELNTQCVVHGLEHGTGRPLVAPDRAVFDRLKARKSGGTPPKR